MTAQVVTQTPSVQPNNSDGVINFSSGGFATDSGTAAAFTINVGFTPRKFRIVNITDLLVYEQLDQMAAADTLLTTGSTGAITLDTSSLVTIGDRTVTLAAGVMVASKTFVWEAWA